MLTAVEIVPVSSPKFPNCRGRLRGFGLGILFLATSWIWVIGCADEEAHYLPPLPDLSTGTSATAGVPCEVSKLVTARCIGCHNQPPVVSGLALVSYADLSAQSTADPTKKVAERMLVRMQSPASPMPPGAAPTVPATEFAPLQTWVTAGLPMTTCTSAAAAPNPGAAY